MAYACIALLVIIIIKPLNWVDFADILTVPHTFNLLQNFNAALACNKMFLRLYLFRKMKFAVKITISGNVSIQEVMRVIKF